MKLHGCKLDRGLEAIRDEGYMDWEGAQQWMARPRRCCATNNSIAAFTWVMNPEELQQLYDGHRTVCPKRQYKKGFFMSISVENKTQDDSPSVELREALGI